MDNGYLYRAKRTDTGEWVEGALFDGEKYCIIGQRIKFSPYVENECKIVGYKVDRNTICRCTGHKDDKGKLIWEGDIIAFLDTYSTESGYAENNCIGRVCWDDETLSFQVTDRLSAESYEVLQECRVIGNIYDDADLLE